MRVPWREKHSNLKNFKSEPEKGIIMLVPWSPQKYTKVSNLVSHPPTSLGAFFQKWRKNTKKKNDD